MKKYLLILLSCLSLSASAQLTPTSKSVGPFYTNDHGSKLIQLVTNHGNDTLVRNADYLAGISNLRLTQLGNIYVKNSWTTTTIGTDFPNRGATTTAVSNHLSVSTAGIIPYSTYRTRSQYWKFTERIIVGTKNATPTLYQVGISPGNTANATSLYAQFDASTGANSGKLAIVNSGGTLVLSSAAITFSAGDSILLVAERIQDNVFAKVTNLTTKTGYIALQTSFAPNNTAVMPNTNVFFTGITSANGMTIDSIAITSTATVNANLAIVGASKTNGAFADNEWSSFARKIAQYFPNTIIMAGGGDKTADFLAALPELLALHPKQVLLGDIAVNDILQSVPAATWHANFASYISQLQAAGIIVRTLDGIYDTIGSNVIYNWLWQNYPSLIIPAFKIGQKTPGTLNADNTHPTQLGHDVAFEQIIQSPLLKWLVNNRITNITGNSAFIRDSIRIGNTTITPSLIPSYLDLGASYSSVPLSQSAYKIRMFNNGTIDGFGSDGNGLYYGTHTGAKHQFIINGALVGTLSSTINWLGNINIGNTISPTSTATPLNINLGATYMTTAGTQSALKVVVFNTGSSYCGLGMSLTAMEYHTYTGITHDWFVNGVRQMRLDAGGILTMGVAGTTAGTVALSGATSGTSTLAAPSVAGSAVSTLPSTTGTLTTRVANNDLTGLTGASSPIIVTYTPSVTGNFTVSAYTYVTAVSGGTVSIYINYTDQNNFSQTGIFYNQGSTTATIGTTSPSDFPPMRIRAKAGTAITVLINASGTITYDAGATISQ